MITAIRTGWLAYHHLSVDWIVTTALFIGGVILLAGPRLIYWISHRRKQQSNRPHALTGIVVEKTTPNSLLFQNHPQPMSSLEINVVHSNDDCEILVRNTSTDWPAENVQVALLGIDPPLPARTANTHLRLPFPPKFPVYLKPDIGDSSSLNPGTSAPFVLFRVTRGNFAGVFNSVSQCLALSIPGYESCLIMETEIGGRWVFPQFKFIVQVSSRSNTAKRYHIIITITRGGPMGPTFISSLVDGD